VPVLTIALEYCIYPLAATSSKADGGQYMRRLRAAEIRDQHDGVIGHDRSGRWPASGEEGPSTRMAARGRLIPAKALSERLNRDVGARDGRVVLDRDNFRIISSQSGCSCALVGVLVK
jgi:hypothetical protein